MYFETRSARNTTSLWIAPPFMDGISPHSELPPAPRLLLTPLARLHILTMPKTWTLKVDNYFQANPHCIIATAHVDTFPTDLPLEPNIREPNRKSTTHRQILDSITTQPEKFFSRHNGIVLCANKVKAGKDKLELEILEASEGGSDGIINGGHTILAFETARSYKYNLSKARVKVTIHIGLVEEDASYIALSSNTTAPVDARSKTNAKGDYDFIKSYLAQLGV